MSSRKDGFTLIELLAVIVVLAIVALIATPIILNVVEKAKIGSFKSSILSGYNALEYRLLEVQLSDIPKDGIDVSSLKLKNNFKSGKYKKDLYGNVIAENITNGEYCANGDVKNPTITKGDCSTLLVLPEDRMMDSYVDDELDEQLLNLETQLMFIYNTNPSIDLTTNDMYIEAMKLENLLLEKVEQQKKYFFPDELLTINEDNEIVLPEIEKVTTHNSSMVPVNVIYSKDISHKQDGKVMVWFLDEDNDEILEMHIGQDGGVVAPKNSRMLFSGFGNEYDLSNFNTSYVTDMSYMFEHCEKITSLDLSNFDTSNVTNMTAMFNLCYDLVNLNLSSFDTSNVTDMNWMFRTCPNLTNLNVSGFDTSKVTNMSNMFYNCPSLLSLNVSNFNTSQVTNMMEMFGSCSGLTNLNVSGFDTSKVTNMSNMFDECSSLTSLDVSGFDTSKVTDMRSMFRGCKNLTSLDLTSFNTLKVTDMSEMFSWCGNLTTITVGSKWVTAPTADDMFYNCGTSTLTIV